MVVAILNLALILDLVVKLPFLNLPAFFDLAVNLNLEAVFDIVTIYELEAMLYLGADLNLAYIMDLRSIIDLAAMAKCDGNFTFCSHL